MSLSWKNRPRLNTNRLLKVIETWKFYGITKDQLIKSLGNAEGVGCSTTNLDKFLTRSINNGWIKLIDGKYYRNLKSILEKIGER